MDKLIYNSGFGILPKAVMIDPNLSLQAKGIFAYLVTYAGNSETAFPSQKTISYQLRISKDTVGKYIKELNIIKSHIDNDSDEECSDYIKNLFNTAGEYRNSFK